MQPWPESGLFTDDSLSLSLPSMPASLLTPFLCRPRLSRLPWSYIVVDEGHRLKNAGCKLNAELRGYSAQHRLLLTGVCGGWQMGSRVGWYNCLQVPLPLYISTASRTPLQALRCRTDWTSCGACSTSSCPRSSTLATTSSSGKSVQQEGPFHTHRRFGGAEQRGGSAGTASTNATGCVDSDDEDAAAAAAEAEAAAMLSEEEALIITNRLHQVGASARRGPRLGHVADVPAAWALPRRRCCAHSC